MLLLNFQAILASAFAKRDYAKATATASRVLQVIFKDVFTKFCLVSQFGGLIFAYDSIMQLGLVLGLFLSIIIPVVLELSPRLFAKDADVLNLMSIGIPVPLSTSSIVCVNCKIVLIE